jgi:glycosyltransferase involved in cell wall biosynthesis
VVTAVECPVPIGLGEDVQNGNGPMTAVRPPRAEAGRRAYGLLVIIPAFNEERSLPGVLDELHECAPDCDVVVVSDGSRDQTARVARAHGAAVVELPFNLGIGGALRTGFRYAVDHDYRAAVQFDADGQHDPREIGTLVGGIDRGLDLVIGSRWAEGGEVTYDVARARRRAMGILRRFVKLLVGQTFTDTSSGFRGFSRRMLKYFAQNYPLEYMDSVEALVMACNAGFRVGEVPTRIRERQHGAPSTRNFKLVYYYSRLLITMAVTAPRHRTEPRPAGKRKAIAREPERPRAAERAR